MAHSKWTLGIIAWLCFSLSSVHSLKVTTSLKGFIVYIDDIPVYVIKVELIHVLDFKIF